MDLQWDALGVVGLVAALITLGMAIFVLRVGRGNPQNLTLAVVLLAEGVHIGVFNGAQAFLVHPDDAILFLRAGIAALLFLPFAYLAFLGHVDTPLTKPLRIKGVRESLLAMGVAAAVGGALKPDLLFFTDGDAVFATLNFYILEALAYAVNLFALVASLAAYLSAPTGTSRGRARAFAIAFGTRDALSAAFVIYAVLVAPNIPTLSDTAQRLVHGYDFVSLIVLIYVPLMGYGIVKYQLFDIDLQIKRSIRVSAIAGLFLMVFFIVAQIAQSYLQQYGVVAGGAAAGLLLFALNPIQKAAERLSDKAMPNTHATPEYVAYKKFEVYRAAFEGVIEDGRVSAKERAMLIGLRAKLGINELDASALEDDVRSTLVGSGRPVAA